MEFLDYISTLERTPLSEAVSTAYSVIFEAKAGATAANKPVICFGTTKCSVPKYIDEFMQSDVLPEINSDEDMQRLGISVEYIPDYDFKYHRWIAALARSRQTDPWVVPLAINKNMLEEYYAKNADYGVDDLEAELYANAWHEVGHLIEDRLNDSHIIRLGKKTKASEDFAEDFCGYMMGMYGYSSLRRKVKDMSWAVDALELARQYDPNNAEQTAMMKKYAAMATREGY